MQHLLMATRLEIMIKQCVPSQKELSSLVILPAFLINIINGPPILLRIYSNINLSTMQQGSTNRVVPQAFPNPYH